MKELRNFKKKKTLILKQMKVNILSESQSQEKRPRKDRYEIDDGKPR